MTANWLKTRQTKYSIYVSVFILVVLGILGAANWLANRYNKSYDSTSNKRYSLSAQTEKVVKGLKNDVNVTYYDRTSQFNTARDLLDRYNNLSTKLKVEFVDPDKKPQLARAAGIEKLGTIIVTNGVKRQEAKSLSEEELTSAIIRSMKEGKKQICFVKGSGEHEIEDSGRSGYSEAKSALEKDNHAVETISLLEKAEVPSSCTVAVVGGPRFDYPQPVVDAIRKFVESGGRAMFLVDPPLQVGKQPIGENAALAAMVEDLGVTLNKDLALDTSGIGQIFGLSEVAPLGTKYEDHPIVREMKGVATAFPLTRSVEIKTGKKGTAQALLSTSANSYASTNLASAQIDIKPGRDKKGPLTLAAAGSVPATGDKKEGRYVVVGGSGWAANSILGFNGNKDLFLNMVSWLTNDEDLISIRPKDPQDRRITLTRAQMNTLRSVTQFGYPLLIIAMGIVVWWKRR
ncbi:MAG: GldG family protein [Bryobacteraceae bacterium]